MQFQVRILGSSSALPTSTRMPTAQVVLYNTTPFLIDCAEGTQMQLRKNRISLLKINHIFISHIHGDHIFGIFGLLSSLNLLGRKSKLNIYATPELKLIYETVFDLMSSNDFEYEISFHPLTANGKNKILETKHLEIYSFPLKHSKQSYGFIFQEKEKLLNIKKELIEEFELSIADIVKLKMGEEHVLNNGEKIKNDFFTFAAQSSRSYVFCTDTLPLKNLTNYFTNPNLLYHEATFLDNEKDLAKKTFHSTASQAAEIAKLLGAKQLIIGHFSSRYKDMNLLVKQAQKIFENTVEAQDGLLIDVI